MHHTFSIIVPLYNCQNILEQLFDTLTNQTCKDFEVIFIDDCSCDDTINKFNKFKDKINFEYQLLMNCENKGPGISRNLCLEQANGQYIFFLDSDDCINVDTLEKINKTIIENDTPDAVLFDYFTVYKQRKIKCNTIFNFHEGFVSSENAMIYSTGATWCKVYKLGIIKDNNVFFPDMRTKEDFVFNKIALSFCKTIFYLKDNLYEYVVNSDSVMNTTKLLGEANAKKAFDILEKKIDKKYSKAISILKIKEYLFGTLQSMVRMRKRNIEIKNFIDKYEEQNPGWKMLIHTHKFDIFTTLILKLTSKRAVPAMVFIILFKDKIKKHFIK